jgi:site-specific recombinase XerD
MHEFQAFSQVAIILVNKLGTSRIPARFKTRKSNVISNRPIDMTISFAFTFAVHALIARASPITRKKFFEFFTVPIRNANTRAAYYRAIQQFLAWAERAGYQELEDIEPITVAAYIEILQRQAAPPTVKQHMAAIRMLFSWLTEKGVLAMNPAREVKTEKFSRTEGKTPAFVEGEVQKLLGAIETTAHTGLRDRALLGVLAYTFARIGAVVNLKVEDYYPSGKTPAFVEVKFKRFLARSRHRLIPASVNRALIGVLAYTFARRFWCKFSCVYVFVLARRLCRF